MSRFPPAPAAAPSQRGRLPDWATAARVLLIRLRSIGDTVLMTPCLSAIKAWRPDIELTVLSEPTAAPVLEDHALVDRLIITGGAARSRARLVAELRGHRFDVAFNLHGGTTGTILAALSGARHTVGYKGYRHSWLLGLRAPSPDLLLGRARLHSVEQQLALITWTGVPWPASGPRLTLEAPARSQGAMRDRLARLALGPAGAGPPEFAVIAPAAAAESKRWPARSFAAMADHLNRRWNMASIVVAGAGHEPLAREVADAALCRPAVLTGLSLKELMALISMARIYVGNDSGPMHIAAALERPVVALFGSSNPEVWHPWTASPYRVLLPPEAPAEAGGHARRHQPSLPGAGLPGARGTAYPISRIPAEDCAGAVDEVMEISRGAPAPAGIERWA